MSAIIKKIIADLLVNKARSILVALSIAVGIFAVGIMINAKIIVKHDMELDYFSTNPHTARLYTQDFEDNLLEILRGLPEIESVDASYNLWVKIASSSNKLFEINLNSIDSIDSMQVDKIVLESGADTLNEGEIYLERQGAAGLGLNTGDPVKLTLNDGQVVTLKLAGIVHDVHANPFNFNSRTSGFVIPAEMAKLGGSNLNNFLNLVTSGSHTDADHVREMAEKIANVVTANGFTVFNVNVINPGQPPAQATVDTVMALLGALNVLIVLLSAFLVTNTISALMSQQIKYIGVIKAIGATFTQVIGIYLGLVIAFGLIALLIAIPLSTLASYGLTRWLIGMLNANPSAFVVPLESILVQLVIGLVVPIVGALLPVVGGAKKTVREAITSYGLNANAKPGLIDLMLKTITWLPRPLILSIRNTFRRKARLFLTLATLILGGAIFIAMLGVRESMYTEVDQSFSYFQSDVNATFARNYPSDELHAAVADIPGISRVESWTSFNANIVRPDEKNTDLIAVYIPPVNTELLNPTMIDGRWLQAGDENAIVVSNHFINLRPEIGIGDTVKVRWNEKDSEFQVVGIFRMSGTYPAPFTYITPEGLTLIGGDSSQANELKLVTDLHTPERQEEILAAVQTRLSDQELEATLQTGSEIIGQQRSVVNILISLLVAMGLLIAIVGGLGLMGTMGMNVLERTREIGVLRSIGAGNAEIFRLILMEGLLIGLISWGLSALVAIPITMFLDNSLGQALMTVPIVYIFSVQGLFVWLIIVLVLSTIACMLPARNAVRLTIRDILAYE
ncbi:MAG TPA: FtsX-like permease family protein [Anaerolineaceae bacterium]|nr:FtsX-like permease family protein [Anaerolineaceae bacterium]